MIYLIDNQLPVALSEHLKAHGVDAIHVSNCGLEHADDLDIWNYARTNQCVIVSKDEDFIHLAAKDTSGPAFVWVRLGNCRNTTLCTAFDNVLSDLLEAIVSGIKVVEIR